MSEIEIQIDKIHRTPKLIKAAGDVEVDVNAKRVGIKTLGCKVNAYESELIGETLQTDNWAVVPNNQEADLYLINTCTVTREADRQARQEVRRAVKRNPDALVVVTGCYAQMDADACANIPGVDLVLGNDRKLDLHKILPQLQAGDLPKVMVGDLDEHLSLPEQLLTGYEAQTRAFVQIQQGCNQGCTFCIIHVARGPSRSLAPTLIKRQVQRLVMNGYPEIVICGVDLGSYGEDFPENSERIDLVALLRELLFLDYDPDNPFRIRLSSIDPVHITDDLIDLMANEPRICSHIHLSLQSGNTLILKRMKRRYDAGFVRERIKSVRARVPDLVISADVMVGFPTETEEQYLDSEEMLRELEIAFPHTFSYSERDGTPAARIPESKQVDMSVRKQRNARLRKSSKPILEAVLKRSVGHEVFVLPENVDSPEGYTRCRAENYLSVLVDSELLTKGKWTKVKLTAVKGSDLLGHPC